MGLFFGPKALAWALSWPWNMNNNKKNYIDNTCLLCDQNIQKELTLF